MTEDNQLLEQFRRDRSDAAFGELVGRHIDLVYATALRMANGDRHLAQDITQTVFITLARKADGLPRDVVLAGWLHRHTCFTASSAIRTESRRRLREQTAMEMRLLEDNDDPAWAQIAPHLDAGLTQLKAAERDALVLRFLKRQDLRTVGAALGISEDAAQKRVIRALERLREVLRRRGVVVTAVGLASALAAGKAMAAPVGLAATVTTISLASMATKNATTFYLIKLMASTKFQSGVLAALILAGVVAPLAVVQQARADLRRLADSLRQQAGQLAELQQEHARLANLAAGAGAASIGTNHDPQANEVLRLRGEIGVLNARLRDLRAGATNGSLTREAMLAAMRQAFSDRVGRLKGLFAANPSMAVPELSYLSESKWLDLTFVVHPDSDPDNRRAMSNIRSRAQGEFAMMMSQALQEYGQSHGGQFPAAVSDLAPYFKTPVDDAVLQDWIILPTSRLSTSMQVRGKRVITQKGPVDADLDQRLVVGPGSMRIGKPSSSDWLVTPQ